MSTEQNNSVGHITSAMVAILKDDGSQTCLGAFKNWGISCSPGVMENFKTGKHEALVQAKIASCLCKGS